MGQYYRALVGEHVLDPNMYKDGSKLMEHSWLGTEFTNTVLTMLTYKPEKVYWVGDYTQDMPEIFDKCWDCADDNTFHYKLESKVIYENEELVGYLLNHTKHEYVSLLEYQDKVFDLSEWAKDFYFAHPLPILTATSNGLGGGDYNGNCMDMVGWWEGDEIEYTEDTNNIRSMYKNITDDVLFYER